MIQVTAGLAHLVPTSPERGTRRGDPRFLCLTQWLHD
jgi:hypothetical protein